MVINKEKIFSLSKSRIEKTVIIANKIAHSNLFLASIVLIFTVVFIWQMVEYSSGSLTLGLINNPIAAININNPITAWRGWIILPTSWITSICYGVALILMAKIKKSFVIWIWIGAFSSVISYIMMSLWLSLIGTIINAILYTLVAFKMHKLNNKKTQKNNFHPKRMNINLFISLFAMMMVLGLILGFGISNIPSDSPWQDPTPYLDGLILTLPILGLISLSNKYISGYFSITVMNIIMVAQGIIIHNYILLIESLINALEDFIGLLNWTFIYYEQHHVQYNKILL